MSILDVVKDANLVLRKKNIFNENPGRVLKILKSLADNKLDYDVEIDLDPDKIF